MATVIIKAKPKPKTYKMYKADSVISYQRINQHYAAQAQCRVPDSWLDRRLKKL